MGHAEERRWIVLRLAGVLCAVAALVMVVFAAAPAEAYESYQHGGIDDCETCHVNAHTWWTPTNEHCLTCHTGYQVERLDRLCWTCHTPGQDMDWARTDTGCTSDCHLRGGVSFAHATHPDRSTACTTCHPVSASLSDPAGSAHHVVPAPRLDTVTPTAASPGATVTLTGRRFTRAAIVRFGGVNAAFSITSDAQIVAVVPAAAVSGPVTVLSPGGTATSSADFMVVRPVPPALTLRATPATFALGRRVRLAGLLTPVGSGISPVTIGVQRRLAGVWKAAASHSRSPDASGVYGWSYRPRHAGAYRARASFPAAGLKSAWANFRVRQAGASLTP